MSSSTRDASDSNVVVVRGEVTSQPTARALSSGSTAFHFDLGTTTEIDGRTGKVSVPVVWNDPPARGLDHAVVGERVVVVGAVRRRFFRVAGATQSRTEVVVSRLVPERWTKSVRSAIAAAVDRLAI